MRTLLLAAALVLFSAALPARAQYGSGYGGYSYDNYGIAGAIQNYYSWVGASSNYVAYGYYGGYGSARSYYYQGQGAYARSYSGYDASNYPSSYQAEERHIKSAPYRIVARAQGAGAADLRSEVSTQGSEVSPYSWRNRLATSAPRLYDADGNYRGRLSTNEVDPDSISNPVGIYGSTISPQSVNNPIATGSEKLYILPEE